ncbi:hypothetical protein L208DRAFT_1378223 [Tricholoma matsutake]|nr:hypothetical protein L208DRAFT_1378223 [Tricholoma matsutake 945]
MATIPTKHHHNHTVLCTVRCCSCDAPQIQVHVFPKNKDPFPNYGVWELCSRPPVLLKDKMEVFIEDVGIIQLQEVTGTDDDSWIVYRGVNLRVKYTELWIAVKEDELGKSSGSVDNDSEYGPPDEYGLSYLMEWLREKSPSSAVPSPPIFISDDEVGTLPSMSASTTTALTATAGPSAAAYIPESTSISALLTPSSPSPSNSLVASGFFHVDESLPDPWSEMHTYEYTF